MDGYIGEVKMFAGTFAPVGWMFCQGQQLNIQQNAALYSIIGIQFGGNGSTVFNLPDLRSRVPVGAGQGTGLSVRNQGALGGTETVTLNINQIPAHKHTVNGLSGGIETNTPKNNFLPEYVNTAAKFYSIKDNPADVLLPMNVETVTNTGGSQAHENMPPFMSINYIICVNGMYPERP